MYPPPPYAAAEEAEAARPTIEQPPVRWHPKITPCRLFVLLSTIALGTVKAALAYRGQSMASTTLEWIGGTVFALLVFFLEEWEVHESYPKHLEWLFAFDCASLIWRAMHAQRPTYRSDESSTDPNSKVAVTGYRLVVSATVAALGVGKATLAYLGHNTTATTVDWILGVLVTCFFYCIGFYESNSAGLAPTFFVRDHSPVIIRNNITVITILTEAVGMYICILWLDLSISFFNSATSDFGEVGPDPFGIYVRSLRIIMLCGVFICGLCNVLGFVFVSVLFLLTVQQELQRAICFVFNPATSSRLLRWASSTIERAVMRFQQPFSHILKVGIPSLWSFAYLFAILIVTAYAFLMVSFVIAIGNEVWKGITLDWIIIAMGVLFLYVTFRLFVILYYLLLALVMMVRQILF